MAGIFLKTCFIYLFVCLFIGDKLQFIRDKLQMAWNLPCRTGWPGTCLWLRVPPHPVQNWCDKALLRGFYRLTERCAYCYSLPATGGTVPQKRTVANSPLTSTLLPMTSNGTMSLIIGQQESKIRDLGRKTWQTDKSLISRNCGLHWPQELKLTANPPASIAHVLG